MTATEFDAAVREAASEARAEAALNAYAGAAHLCQQEADTLHRAGVQVSAEDVCRSLARRIAHLLPDGPPGVTAEVEMLAEAESIACAEDWDSNNDKIRAIASLVRSYARAALRERDAAWAAAVKASGLMLSPDSDNEAWKPLCALLEEAGK